MESNFQKFLEIARTDSVEPEDITTFFVPKRVEKGEYFLREGELCRNVAFIESGLLLYSRLDDKGLEVICDLARENDWVTQYESFISQRASPLSIKAIEHTTLQVISYDRLQQLYAAFPTFERITRRIIEKVLMASLNRTNELQVLNAEERYEKFARENPDLVQRIPQYLIASYLGIAPQSLSRIRKKK